MNSVAQSKEKPVLDPESFQRLLAAAFMLQSQNDPSSPKLIGGGHPRTFAIQGIVQNRTPSLRKPALQPNRLKSLVQFANPMSWRPVEPLAIAIVFCMMTALSIHRLSAVPSRTSLASEMLDKQNERARPAEKVIASPQPVAGRNSRQPSSEGEADIVAEDIVIRHQKRLVNLPGKPSVRLVFGQDAAADTVVQYGADVKMWSRKPEGATLNRLED
jgi:hypothetical protein